MASQFSGALQLTDLDDFISPSQQCIKPVPAPVKRATGSSRIKIESDGSYVSLNEKGEQRKLEKVSITLNDCLACSGCVTSAESVLIGQQSIQQLRDVIKQRQEWTDKHLVVMSLSVPAVASLAVRHKLPIEQAVPKLCSFLKHHGFHRVYDLSTAHDICLLESGKEFVRRFKEREAGTKTSLPMLTSACPGWVCYAEKTHGSFVLPYIASTKSPQQIMGSLVKDYVSAKEGIPPSRIYHVTLMPCYDKKLEASRSDFYSEVVESHDVDCVVTPLEIQDMMDEEKVQLSDVEEYPLDSFLSPQDQSICTNIGSASGGYLEYVIRYAAKELLDVDVQELSYVAQRNKDLQEVTVTHGDGRAQLKFAFAYGFRNIQNIVQKIKRKKMVYDFVEIMACPQGCLNGGGQLRSAGSDVNKDQLLEQIKDAYNVVRVQLPASNPDVERLYGEWLCGADGKRVKQMLHTVYHYIEKDDNALAIKW